MSRVFWPSTGIRASTSPGGEVLAVADLDQRADREADRHRVVGAGDLHLVAGDVEQLHLRTDDLGRAAPLRVDHDQRRQARDLVELLGDGDAFLDVLELRLAGELGDDRAGQRVPGGEHRAGLDLLVGLDAEQRAVRHLVALALAAVRVGDDDLAGAGDHHQLALAVGHVAHGRVEADRAFGLGVDARGHRRARCRAADVEGAHRQLRARLADRLRRDHADRLADVDQAAAAQVAAVALGADAEARAAGERGADLDLVDRRRLEARRGVSSSSISPARERAFPASPGGGCRSPRRGRARGRAGSRSPRRPRPGRACSCRSCVAQSSSITTRSCVTSTRRRVR